MSISNTVSIGKLAKQACSTLRARKLALLFAAPALMLSSHAALAGVIGTIDSANSNGVVYGWACAQGNYQPVTVQIYVGNSPENGGMLAGVGIANQANEPAVNTACNAGGSHRFGIQLGASYPPGTRIFIYGVSPGGASLVNSGSVYIP